MIAIIDIEMAATIATIYRAFLGHVYLKQLSADSTAAITAASSSKFARNTNVTATTKEPLPAPSTANSARSATCAKGGARDMGRLRCRWAAEFMMVECSCPIAPRMCLRSFHKLCVANNSLTRTKSSRQQRNQQPDVILRESQPGVLHLRRIRTPRKEIRACSRVQSLLAFAPGSPTPPALSIPHNGKYWHNPPRVPVLTTTPSSCNSPPARARPRGVRRQEILCKHDTMLRMDRSHGDHYVCRRQLRQQSFRRVVWRARGSTSFA